MTPIKELPREENIVGVAKDGQLQRVDAEAEGRPTRDVRPARWAERLGQIICK